MGILTAIIIISLNLILFHIQKKIQQKINPNFYKPKRKYYQKYKKQNIKNIDMVNKYQLI